MKTILSLFVMGTVILIASFGFAVEGTNDTHPEKNTYVVGDVVRINAEPGDKVILIGGIGARAEDDKGNAITPIARGGWKTGLHMEVKIIIQGDISDFIAKVERDWLKKWNAELDLSEGNFYEGLIGKKVKSFQGTVIKIEEGKVFLEIEEYGGIQFD